MATRLRMARYQIHHRTVYHYAQPVAVSHHCACLTPLNAGRQQLHNFTLEVNPEASDLSSRTDFFGNKLHFFSLHNSHGEFVVNATSEVSVQPVQLPLPQLMPTCEETRQVLDEHLTAEAIDALQYTFPSACIEISDTVRAFAENFASEAASYYELACRLARHIYEEFEFDPTATDIATPISEILEQRRGVCQDFAHLMIGCLRALRLPARYVSGYILTHPPEGQERLIGADASHAWVSIYIPHFGWLDIDPTNAQFASEEHIIVAVGRDFDDVSMLKGAVTGGGEHTIGIEVTMTPLIAPESERLTLPGHT